MLPPCIRRSCFSWGGLRWNLVGRNIRQIYIACCKYIVLEKGLGDRCRQFLYKSRQGLSKKNYLEDALYRPPVLGSCCADQDVHLAGLLYRPALSTHFVDCGVCGICMSQWKAVVCWLIVWSYLFVFQYFKDG